MLIKTVERRAHRVGQHDPAVGVTLFQGHADAGQGAAGADGAGKAVNLAVQFFPHFRAGGFYVGAAVGDIIELIGPDCAGFMGLRHFLGDALGHVDIVFRVGVGDRVYFAQVSAGDPEHVFLFLGLRARDDDDGFVAARRRHKRQADTGVAGGAFDDHASGFQQAAFFRILDDIERGAVFHRAARIQEFRLAVYVAAGFLGRLA